MFENAYFMSFSDFKNMTFYVFFEMTYRRNEKKPSVYQRFVHLRGNVGFKAFLLLLAHVLVLVGNAHSR